jgi:hypothetical protein
MDKNLCLLKPEELYLFQQIEGEQKKRIMNQRFSFCETRKNLNLIIVSEREEIINETLNNIPIDIKETIKKEGGNEIKKIKGHWEDEERRIREAIKRERQRRENPDNRDGVEPWPELPNYEDAETCEPHPLLWNDLPVDDNNELLNNIINDVSKFCKKNQGDTCNNKRTYNLTQNLERLYQTGFMLDMDNIYEDELSNYQMMLMDDRLMQLRQYKQRLNNGNLLGYLLRSFDGKGEETIRTIYLLLDNIQDYASKKGEKRTEILASVYVHELFHAYYSNSKSKKHYLITRIREIEETMAEFGMLCFIQANFNDLFKTAYDSVKEKLGNQNLWCYGLGASLYDIMITNGIGNNTFGGKILEVYHAIQLSVRNSRQLITNLKGILQANKLVEHKYATQLIYLFDIHRRYKLLHPDRNTVKDSFHYFFNGRAYGRNNDVVYAALDYYVSKTNATFQDITNDFAALCNQTSPCFCELNNPNLNPNDYDITKQIPLQNTIIVLKKIWKTDVNGDMFNFMKEVDKLNQSGRLDKKVLYLG